MLVFINNISGENGHRKGNAGGRHSEINAGIWQTGLSDCVGISEAVLAFSLPVSTLVNKNCVFVDIIAISKMFCRKRSSAVFSQ